MKVWSAERRFGVRPDETRVRCGGAGMNVKGYPFDRTNRKMLRPDTVVIPYMMGWTCARSGQMDNPQNVMALSMVSSAACPGTWGYACN